MLKRVGHIRSFAVLATPYSIVIFVGLPYFATTLGGWPATIAAFFFLGGLV
jgi:hypothetical protein